MIAVDSLRQVPLFADLSDEQLQRLAELAKEVYLEPGDYLCAEGETPSSCYALLQGDNCYALLDGELEITKKSEDLNQPTLILGPGTFLAAELSEAQPLQETPCRALSTMHLLQWESTPFWEMLKTDPVIIPKLLTIMTQRLRAFESRSREYEKLIELGTLAAGLAHEMNNLVAASTRSAGQLHETLQELSSLALRLNQQLTPTQLLDVANWQSQVNKLAALALELDPLTQSEREDEITAWLDSRGVTEGWKLAPALVSAGVEQKWLEPLGQQVPWESLGEVLTWIEVNLTASMLLEQVEQSTAHLSELVRAVKVYSHMGQTSLQVVNIHEGLERVLTLLNHKLKKGIAVIRQYDQSLPPVYSYGSELDQVWTNLIDNAIDAMGGQGKIWIRTMPADEGVLVEIADNGPGIPPQIQPRIFEPFFTTKDVGVGTGLGLEISYRIVVKHHKGQISFTSQPGDTRFQVCLPIDLSQEHYEKPEIQASY